FKIGSYPPSLVAAQAVIFTALSTRYTCNTSAPRSSAACDLNPASLYALGSSQAPFGSQLSQRDRSIVAIAALPSVDVSASASTFVAGATITPIPARTFIGNIHVSSARR